MLRKSWFNKVMVQENLSNPSTVPDKDWEETPESVR